MADRDSLLWTLAKATILVGGAYALWKLFAKDKDGPTFGPNIPLPDGPQELPPQSMPVMAWPTKINSPTFGIGSWSADLEVRNPSDQTRTVQIDVRATSSDGTHTLDGHAADVIVMAGSSRKLTVPLVGSVPWYSLTITFDVATFVDGKPSVNLDVMGD